MNVVIIMEKYVSKLRWGFGKNAVVMIDTKSNTNVGVMGQSIT